jgi:hypothetical protein
MELIEHLNWYDHTNADSLKIKPFIYVSIKEHAVNQYRHTTNAQQFRY